MSTSQLNTPRSWTPSGDGALTAAAPPTPWIDAVELGLPVYVVEAPDDAALHRIGAAAYGLPRGLSALKPPTELQTAALVLLHGSDDGERQRMRSHADAFVRAKWASVKLLEVPGETVAAWLSTHPSPADLARREEMTPHHTASKQAKMLPVDWMVEHACKRARLIVSPNQEAFVEVRYRSGALATHAASERAFGQWLMHAHRAEHGTIPPRDAVKQAQEMIEAIAHEDGERARVYMRIARVDDRVYLDLGDDTRRVVEITGDGARVMADSPVFFHRSSVMQALPVPVICQSHGDAAAALARIRSYFRLATQNDVTLFTAWLVYLLSGVHPFPLLSLSGEQDAGKSTAADFAKRLIDPGTPKLLSLPKSQQDLMVSARGRYVLSYDNLSSIQLWLSNAFSSLSTGAGFATRRLHTDTDETVIELARPILLNGIDDVVTKLDLGSRTLRVHLATVPVHERVALSQLEADFTRAVPEILGGLCYAASLALRTAKDHAERPLPLPTRMIDFVYWGRATQGLYNLADGDDFDVAFRSNFVRANEEVADNDAVVNALRELLARRGEWTGTTRALLDDLAAYLPRWEVSPLSPEKLALHIKRISAVFPSIGITYRRFQTTDRRRERMLSFSLLSE